jgi:uncharacterized protein YaiL (DUF2058 family)
MFGRLEDLVNRGVNLKKANLLFFVFTDNYDLQNVIIDLNTNEQLYKGRDATGELLENIGGEYAALTVSYKKSVGEPYDRVTLKDTGFFYKSFNVKAKEKEFEIIADYEKIDDDGEKSDLRGRWGDNLAGLTKESRVVLVKALLPYLREYIINYLLND